MSGDDRSEIQRRSSPAGVSSERLWQMFCGLSSGGGKQVMLMSTHTKDLQAYVRSPDSLLHHFSLKQVWKGSS